MAASTTFTSCKDYDDDIKDLQAQIDASGVDLSAEIKRLEGLLETNKTASENAAAELAQAIKNATNDANGYAEIQAAEAKKAAVDASAALIEQAIENLKNGELQAAQSKADAAYSLAEQAKAAASENKGTLDKLANGLSETNTNLSKALEQINKLNEDLADTKKLVEDNQANLTALQSALNSLKASNEEVHNALSAKDTELKGLIEANQASIKDILENKIPELSTKLTAAENDIKQNAKDIKDIKEDINTNVKPAISALQTEVGKINQYLVVLAENLNNLITGLILQDEQLEIVQAQVVSDVNKTGLTGKTFTELSGTRTIVWFPYKNAADAKNNLVVGKYNVERLAGPVYYTINPTNVNFTDKANIQLENSLMKAPVGLKISAPEASTRTSPITRADDKAPANGLYQSLVTNSDVLRDAQHAGFANSYALVTKYSQKDKEGKVTEKSVYSQYALNLDVVSAVRQTSPDIKTVGADEPPYPSVCGARFTTSFGNPMTAKFNLLPMNDEFGKSTSTAKVYRKYVEVVGIKNARGVAQTGTTYNNLKKAIDGANKDILNKVFEEDTPGFNQITVTIPDNEGSYNFVGSVVTFRYFIQNYDGTIYVKDINVMFAKTLFEEGTVTIEHTPYQTGVNEMVHGLKASDKTDFQVEANCIAVAASNKLWYENTSKIEIKAVGTPFCKIKTVEFRTAEQNNNPKWINETPIATINMNETNSGSVSGLTVDQLKKVKNMVFTYDPASIEVEKEFTFEMYSYDPNGNLVSKLPIKFTMKYPKHHASLISPNPAYFLPYDKDLKAESLAGKTLTAWANKHVVNGSVNDATYNLIAAFNTPWNNADGCVISFDYTDKKDYEPTKKYEDYKPVNTWRLNYASAATDYTMQVPAKAVEYTKEHQYTIQVAVECFGVKSLWYAPYEFNVVFKSAIAWADFKWNKKLYEVEYPSSSLTIGDSEITADDPSTSVADNIKYFGASRDNRIKSTSVKLKDTQFASLFKTIKIADDGSGILIETAESVPGGVGSITTGSITFTFSVEDFYGNVRDYDFSVKVKENK